MYSYNPKQPGSRPFGKIVSFQVKISNVRAEDVTVRHAGLHEKQKIKCIFDDKKFKSDLVRPVSGKLEFPMQEKFTWVLRNSREHQDTASLKSELETYFVQFELKCKHGTQLGCLQVDFFTLVTGPIHHSLPLLDYETKQVQIGRLKFDLEMTQYTDIGLVFKELSVFGLKHPSFRNLNPYLKYAYSKHWRAVKAGTMVACHSDTVNCTKNPTWREFQMPWMIFHASLTELLYESVIVHVNHKGSVFCTNISACKLLFRALVSPGGALSDDMPIYFKGVIDKVHDVSIDGSCILKNLPKFAQMRPVFNHRPAIHTEHGIFDAEPIFSWLPKPDAKITLTDGIPREIPVIAKRMNSVQEVKKEEEEGEDTSSAPPDVTQPAPLIDFTPPSSPTQKRRTTISQIISKEDIKAARNNVTTTRQTKKDLNFSQEIRGHNLAHSLIDL